jgi:predicted DNA-binding transcriptional regulator YafY
LARRVEVSKRAIYRDVSALNQMDIPLAALSEEEVGLMEG